MDFGRELDLLTRRETVNERDFEESREESEEDFRAEETLQLHVLYLREGRAGVALERCQAAK